MLVNIDAKGLEWVTVVWFAQDPVGMEEILNGVDQHTVNQLAFNLPNRLTAKTFVFRLIYGGSKWAYAYDPDFNWISRKPTFWQGVIDRFYDKYKNIRRQHDEWVRTAVASGRLVMPTGRVYTFTPKESSRGGLEWPRTQILNYPVQGTGHDIVTIARVSLFKRINNEENLRSVIRFISTVHDSVVLDCDFRELSDPRFQLLLGIIHRVFADIPDNFYRLFDCRLNLPIAAEVSYGSNLLDKITIG